MCGELRHRISVNVLLMYWIGHVGVSRCSATYSFGIRLELCTSVALRQRSSSSCLSNMSVAPLPQAQSQSCSGRVCEAKTLLLLPAVAPRFLIGVYNISCCVGSCWMKMSSNNNNNNNNNNNSRTSYWGLKWNLMFVAVFLFFIRQIFQRFALKA